ncbi:MAG: hypothetical protein IPM78_10005 [Moraxellaceae bacterium]|nr:hypothetical protein [Moraxellaceae bacterium]
MLRQPNIDDPLLTNFVGALGEQIVAERMADLVGKIRETWFMENAFGEDEGKIKFLANVEKTQSAFLHMGINAKKEWIALQICKKNIIV